MSTEQSWNNVEITVKVPDQKLVRYVVDSMVVRYEPFWEHDAQGKKIEQQRNNLYLHGTIKTVKREEDPPPPPPGAPPPTGPEEQASPMYDLWEKWKGCQACGLSKRRRQVVFGSGSVEKAKILVIGEAPGPEEDRQGIPFIGPTGMMLRQGLVRAGVHPDEDCYITNSVLCFPTEDGTKFRGPRGDEMLACRPRLNAQFEILSPTLRAVLLVGKRAFIDFFRREDMEAGKFRDEKEFEELGLRSHLGWYTGTLPWPNVKVMTVYHPSYFARKRIGESSVEVTEWNQDLKALSDWALRGQFWESRPVR